MMCEKHPSRYPKHEGDKGQVLGGECNTTACKNNGALYYNKCTYGYYCYVCARGINYQDEICIYVEYPLTNKEKDDLYETVDW